MLTEIRCAEFKSNGQPRPPVEFNSGLNTVLGDHIGSNSIGKSTFLMIVDFVFGGDDYVDKSKDVQRQVGGHTIQFAFKFQNQLHFFSRDTITHNRVSKCNEKYEILSEMSVDDFRKALFREYAIALPSISFRDIVTRYFRIYRRENLDENHPLRAVPQEHEEESIASLVKLFGMHAGIEELRIALKEAKEKNETFRRSIQHDFVHGVTTKKQIKENETRIRDLSAQLGLISGQNDTEHQIFLDGLEPEEAQRFSSIKRELAALRQQKSRLETKLAHIQNNLVTSGTDLQDDFSGLNEFFPNANIRKMREIETFHKKLRKILENEFREEQLRTETLISQTERGIDEHQKIIDAEGVPDGMSRKVLDDYHSIKSMIEKLEQSNSAYNIQLELKETVTTVARQLDERQAGQLRELQSSITRKMAELNDFLYNGQKKAPLLTFENGRKYVFETPDDTGTGTSYKGLVLFDISILVLTSLPALVHDSVVLKQIADAPLERILELYQTSGKQVFIALDKVASYSPRAQEILEQSAVLHLSDKGDELFGRSWNVKGSD